MLIDSGADVPLITRQTGIRLGFTVSPMDVGKKRISLMRLKYLSPGRDANRRSSLQH
ncbi:hypothetical protein H8E77_27705 [bacterium]|nr:hypothetical protein [bacterium]